MTVSLATFADFLLFPKLNCIGDTDAGSAQVATHREERADTAGRYYAHTTHTQAEVWITRLRCFLACIPPALLLTGREVGPADATS